MIHLSVQEKLAKKEEREFHVGTAASTSLPSLEEREGDFRLLQPPSSERRLLLHKLGRDDLSKS